MEREREREKHIGQDITILPLKIILQTMSLPSYGLYVNQYTQRGDLVRVDMSQ